MRIVVIGDPGLVGWKLVNLLQQHGHEALAAGAGIGAEPSTGEGLSHALNRADVVVDLSAPPSAGGQAAQDWYAASTANLLAAEAAAGVGHHVGLSVVGSERLGESPHFRARMVQESLVARSGMAYSIVRATQCFEFIRHMIDGNTAGDTVRLAPVRFQPMAAEDVARAVGRVAVGRPVNGVIETAGPEQFRLDELALELLRDRADPRVVVPDPEARYFGARLGERTLLPGDGVRLGEVRLDQWWAQVASLTGRPPRQEFVFTH